MIVRVATSAVISLLLVAPPSSRPGATPLIRSHLVVAHKPALLVGGVLVIRKEELSPDLLVEAAVVRLSCFDNEPVAVLRVVGAVRPPERARDSSRLLMRA